MHVLLPKQVDCFFQRHTKQLLLARKQNVLGHVTKLTWAHSFILCSLVFPSCFFSVVDLWLSLLVQHYKDKNYIIYAFPMDEKPSIFTYRKAHHGHVISGLPRECEGMWSHALSTYLVSVIDHVGLSQIRFSTAATVSCVSKKTVHLFR